MSEALVFQTDFGLVDGAVSAMYGVAFQVDRSLSVFSLTHEIPQYDIWEASYRLVQTVAYWPPGTVFVSVVDPGVGSTRKSIVAKLKTGHFIVTPDNGTLTHVSISPGIEEVRTFNEASNRLSGSELSYTFHGRDVYAFTGARLASGKVKFEELGTEIDKAAINKMALVPATIYENEVHGIVDVLDVRFGNIWTNIPVTLFAELGAEFGMRFELSLRNETREQYRNTMVYAKSFAGVNAGEPLIYINSVLNVAIAINQGSFARAYNVGRGIGWQITLRKFKQRD